MATALDPVRLASTTLLAPAPSCDLTTLFVQPPPLFRLAVLQRHLRSHAELWSNRWNRISGWQPVGTPSVAIVEQIPCYRKSQHPGISRISIDLKNSLLHQLRSPFVPPLSTVKRIALSKLLTKKPTDVTGETPRPILFSNQPHVVKFRRIDPPPPHADKHRNTQNNDLQLRNMVVCPLLNISRILCLSVIVDLKPRRQYRTDIRAKDCLRPRYWQKHITEQAQRNQQQKTTNIVTHDEN